MPKTRKFTSSTPGKGHKRTLVVRKVDFRAKAFLPSSSAKSKTFGRPEAVPAELAGRWIAWSADGLRIEGSGATPEEARSAGGGSPGLVVAWTPPVSQLRPGAILSAGPTS